MHTTLHVKQQFICKREVVNSWQLRQSARIQNKAEAEDNSTEAIETFSPMDSSMQNKRLMANELSKRCSDVIRDTHGHTPLDSVAPFERDEIILGRRIGFGTFSHVYEIVAFRLRPYHSDLYNDEQIEKREAIAKSIYDGAKYVMKCLKDELEQSEDDEDLFLDAALDSTQEAELLAALSHPNIVKLYGVVASRHDAFLDGPSSFFIILERLECTLTDKIDDWAKKKDSFNLSDSLKSLSSIKVGFSSRSHSNSYCSSGALDKLEKALKMEESEGYLEQRFRLAASLAEAVEYLHSKRVIFHDLKPHNIGFDSKNCLKLFDFGLARFLPQIGDGYDDLFELSGAGTPRYTAAEVFLDNPYNLKADVYSFGVVLWEIMCLKKPFAKCKHRKEFDKALVRVEKALAINRRWPQPIQDIIRKSLSKSFERPRMSEVLSVLNECVSERDDVCESVITDASTVSIIPSKSSGIQSQMSPRRRRRRSRCSSFCCAVPGTQFQDEVKCKLKSSEKSETTLSTLDDLLYQDGEEEVSR